MLKISQECEEWIRLNAIFYCVPPAAVEKLSMDHVSTPVVTADEAFEKVFSLCEAHEHVETGMQICNVIVTIGYDAP